MGSRGRRSGWRTAAFVVYVAACLCALTWPGYAWLGNRIEPFVLGIPFSLAWNVGWVAVTFCVLALYHSTASGGD